MAIITLNNNSLSSVTSLPAGVGGKVLQVVSAILGTQISSSSTTYVDTGLSASITPSSASSKILILINHNGVRKESADNSNAINMRLYRDATNLGNFALYSLYTGTTLGLFGSTLSMNYLDSPSTTSSTTYKTQFANFVNASAAVLQDSGAKSGITLMEIAG
jgi:hypothetical protein